MRRALLLAAAVALLAAGCGGSKKSAATTTTSAATTTTSAVGANGCRTVAQPQPGARHEPKPTTHLDPTKTYRITFVTNCGTFTVLLTAKTSPNASASFVSLARKGYFDRTVFHRIVPGFIIQGGDPTASGSGGPGYTTVDPPPASARYTHGVVATAKTQTEAPGTSGSQFFVVTAPDAGLPADYAILGKVVSGLDIVDRIGRLGDQTTEQPTQVVEIERTTVTER
jgi:peptidyl-prolyl cis-trans isomerase B (cyclophilin B)